ncbi:MAG: HAD-IIB family hydrolase [Candidatus Harrisonbacteria bacterium]|nr:HAD-IIB family hydrolase [Candidatus Harrisonbacteria bacterium]
MNEQKFTTYIFDLDGTLTPSKSPIQPDMLAVFCRLLQTVKSVAVISGGNFEQFQTQLLSHLLCPSENLYLLPTSGSQLLHFQNQNWSKIYAQQLSPEEKKTIIQAIEEALQESGVDISKPSYGSRIEDRKSQITFSGLGQDAPLEEKTKWDPDQSKRKSIVSILQKKIPQFQISMGGTSSIDITQKRIDKQYGVERFLEYVGAEKSEAIFFGDALFEGGNDEPVIRTGIHTVAVDSPEQLLQKLEKYAL